MRRVGIVVAGYVLAAVVATLVLRLYIGATSGVDRQTYSGMSAFGDSVLFLAVLGVAAVPATGAALYFLRSSQAFWRVFAPVSLSVAFTALVAVTLLVGYAGLMGSRLQTWSAASPLRILAAPLFALFFLLSALFAPTRSARMALVAACGMEVASFAAAVAWWRLHR